MMNTSLKTKRIKSLYKASGPVMKTGGRDCGVR